MKELSEGMKALIKRLADLESKVFEMIVSYEDFQLNSAFGRVQVDSAEEMQRGTNTNVICVRDLRTDEQE